MRFKRASSLRILRTSVWKSEGTVDYYVMLSLYIYIYEFVLWIVGERITWAQTSHDFVELAGWSVEDELVGNSEFFLFGDVAHRASVVSGF